MTDESSRLSVLLPCSHDQVWAIPQRCLAEIVTVTAEGDRPPSEIDWRGESVPVLDFLGDEQADWRDSRTGTGLVAVMLGLKGGGWRYWGVAVRGEGLGVSEMKEEQMEDAPEAVVDYATAAFRMHGRVYQVPDLGALQRSIGT